MVTVRVDQGGPVLRRSLQPFGFADAGVAFDGVQRQVQPAGALQQANTLIQQVVDLVPALLGGLGPGTVLWPGRFRPAGTVRCHLLHHGLAKVVPQVPTISDLHSLWQCPADRFGVCTRAVSAHDFHAWMGSQPLLQRVGAAIGQDIDTAAGLSVDEHGGVSTPLRVC